MEEELCLADKSDTVPVKRYGPEDIDETGSITQDKDIIKAVLKHFC